MSSKNGQDYKRIKANPIQKVEYEGVAIEQKLKKKKKRNEEPVEVIEPEVEIQDDVNDTEKKLSKKEKKRQRKQLELAQSLNAEDETNFGFAAADEDEQKQIKKNQKESKLNSKEQTKSQDSQVVHQQAQPKISKRPKITIISQEEEELAEELKRQEEEKNNREEQESQEEQEESSDDENTSFKKNKKQLSEDDSEEENFRDIQSEDESVQEEKKHKSKKNKPEMVEKPSAKTEKNTGKSQGKLTNIRDKIQLKHLAICIPDSIISIPQSSELRSYFISELARTAAIFCVDEIIILKDNSYIAKSQNFQQGPYIARNLQYLETPQYLRKQLFPIHPDLKNAGLMNPIECLHHLKSDQFCPYREGVVMNRPVKEVDGSWVEIGLKKQAKIPYKLAPSTRVTLKIEEPTLEIEEKYYTAKVVSQKEPKEKLGLFWGYQVRLADDLSQVFKGENDIKYDIKVLINQGDHEQLSEESINHAATTFENKSLLVVFSGYNNLQSIIDSDEASNLTGKDALLKFDFNYTMQKGGYGVKQLRLEEEMAQALSILRRKFC